MFLPLNHKALYLLYKAQNWSQIENQDFRSTSTLEMKFYKNPFLCGEMKILPFDLHLLLSICNFIHFYFFSQK